MSLMAAITGVACTKSEEDVAMIIGLIGAILGELRYQIYTSKYVYRILVHGLKCVFVFSLTLVSTAGEQQQQYRRVHTIHCCYNARFLAPPPFLSVWGCHFDGFPSLSVGQRQRSGLLVYPWPGIYVLELLPLTTLPARQG